MTAKQVQPNYSEQRLKKLRKKMREQNLDAVFSLDPANARWLSAWSGVFDDEAAHLTLITSAKAYFHTDSRYSDAMMAKNKQGMWTIDNTSIEHSAFAKDIFAKSKKQELRVGFESNIALDVYKHYKKVFAKTQVKLVETTDFFAGLRTVKDEEEIRLLKKAQKITDAAFAELLTWVAPGMTELEVANRLDFALRQCGGEGLSFETIAASGPNSALPHARPGTRRLREGDFLLLDFGATYHDYCADMSRTLAIGKATEKQHNIFNAVLAAQTRAKAGLREGVTGKEAHELAVESLREVGLDKNFTHALGHGVGIVVHEQPRLAPYNTKPLVAGNVVTTEPGVYLKGYGGVRIEDFGVVQEKKFSCFTHAPHELVEITGK